MGKHRYPRRFREDYQRKKIDQATDRLDKLVNGKWGIFVHWKAIRISNSSYIYAGVQEGQRSRTGDNDEISQTLS